MRRRKLNRGEQTGAKRKFPARSLREMLSAKHQQMFEERFRARFALSYDQRSRFSERSNGRRDETKLHRRKTKKKKKKLKGNRSHVFFFFSLPSLARWEKSEEGKKRREGEVRKRDADEPDVAECELTTLLFSSHLSLPGFLRSSFFFHPTPSPARWEANRARTRRNPRRTPCPRKSTPRCTPTRRRRPRYLRKVMRSFVLQVLEIDARSIQSNCGFRLWSLVSVCR